MKIKFNSRKWHAWISFTIALPILLVAVTAILIAHGQKLGFRDIKVDAGWLPGYASAPTQREARATLHTADAFWIGTQVGLYRQDAAVITTVDAFDGQEIRAIFASADDVFVLTAQALFVQSGANWRRISRGPVSSAYVENGKLYATMRDKGLQVSADRGASWRNVDEAQSALAELPALQSTSNKIPLARVIRDLHTGEALLGHDSEWIWNDIVGGTMAFLALTGVYLWWNGQRKLFVAKRARAQSNAVNSVS